MRKKPSIHLIHGFMGFGKTTLSNKLAQTLPAIKLTHDDFMFEQFGRDPDDFLNKYKIVEDFLKEKTAEEIKKGNSVILDYGFWEKETRKNYYNWAKTLTPNVFFHALQCDLNVAKKRVLKRSAENPNELLITEEIFFTRLPRFEPMSEDEGFPVTFYQSENQN